MKLFAMFAAGLVAAATLTPVQAVNAQRGVEVNRRHVVVHQDRRHNVRQRSYRGARYRTVCRTRYSHGRRIRRCVRVRR